MNWALDQTQPVFVLAEPNGVKIQWCRFPLGIWFFPKCMCVVVATMLIRTLSVAVFSLSVRVFGLEWHHRYIIEVWVTHQYILSFQAAAAEAAGYCRSIKYVLRVQQQQRNKKSQLIEQKTHFRGNHALHQLPVLSLQWMNEWNSKQLLMWCAS